MAKRARESRSEAPPDDPRRPEVIVDFVFDDGLFHVAIENIGGRPAIDVSVTFDRAFHGLGGEQDVSSLPLFRGVPFLAPRRRISTLLDASAAYFARREPTKIVATVTYADRSGAAYKDVIRHDLEIYRDVISCRRVTAGESL